MVRLPAVLDRVTVPCEQCGVELAGDSPDFRLNLTCDDEPLFYWNGLGTQRWQPTANSTAISASRPA